MTAFIKSLAVASVAAAALALPVTAQAGEYRKCKDTENAVAGGLIGGSVGTIIGEELAGRGNRTEGAIAGAVIGGVVGAAIGDGVSDCEKDGRIYRNGRHIGNVSGYHADNYRNVRGNPRYHDRRWQDDRWHNGRQDGRWRDGRRWNDGYRGYSAQQHDRDLRRIDRRINRLRAERRDLKERRYYERRTRWIDRRLHEISYEIDYLKDERRRAKRRWNDYRRHYRR